MGAESSEINITELLIQMSKDIASIKTDFGNLKETSKSEKENFAKELTKIRSDFTKDVDSLEASFAKQLTEVLATQEKLKSELSVLKGMQEKKDAEKWRKVVGMISTALAGIFLAKLPDIINLLLSKGS